MIMRLAFCSIRLPPTRPLLYAVRTLQSPSPQQHMYTCAHTHTHTQTHLQVSHHIHTNDEVLDEDVCSMYPLLRFDNRLPRLWCAPRLRRRHGLDQGQPPASRAWYGSLP
jgi:hypothetical protein